MVESHRIIKHQQFMQSKAGKVVNLINKILSIICLFNVFSSIRNIITDDKQVSETFDRNIEQVKEIVPMADYFNSEMLLQYASFLFAGILIFQNVKNLFD